MLLLIEVFIVDGPLEFCVTILRVTIMKDPEVHYLIMTQEPSVADIQRCDRVNSHSTSTTTWETGNDLGEDASSFEDATLILEMPPFVPRKRQFSPDASASSSPAPVKSTRKGKNDKTTLFEAIDAPASAHRSVADTKRLLDSLNDSDDASSLSELGSDEFEDVPPAKRQKTSGNAHRPAKQTSDDDDDDDDDEELSWEDAYDQDAPQSAAAAPADQDIGDISISLNEDGNYVEPVISLATGKKGPSKRERQTRDRTHRLHVLTLMWHNTVRNSWVNDKEVQKILVDGLPDGIKREIRRWKAAMGMTNKKELDEKKKQAAMKAQAKKGRKSNDYHNGRDWSYDANHLDAGVANVSRGDPLFRLLKVLAAYWRKRFLITAPGLRKQGYLPLKRLRDKIRDWDKNRLDFEAHGERIEDIKAFRKSAKEAEGSRDVGAQLFVALLRGIGLETRMVANLQPAGLSFNTREDGVVKSKDTKAKSEESNTPVTPQSASTTPQKGRAKAKAPTKEPGSGKSSTRPQRGNKDRPITLDDTDSELSDPPSEIDEENADNINADSDDSSVIDVTPVTPRKKPIKKYDRDLAFPNYWAEVCSPLTHRYIPVDPIVLSTIASNDELLQTFEPRGMRADKAKQVICYTIAFSSDGSAKDVTVRYLKKHQLSGKTKGMRVPVEKVPVYNARGKVKKHENFDWFRTVMSMYDRPHKQRTAADDLEEQTDLKPYKPAAEAKETEKESLQWYKQSAEFVLESHLRREEAILPGSAPVKTFTAGKGDKAKEHLVYLRKDVVACKTVESWHKEGRAIRVGEQPMKVVPVRAVTLIRKREMEDALRETGEKLKQGLYSRDQTDWIIPPPIENGVIPKNAFGNMDVYVPTMVPEGAVHLPLKGTAKICRKLEIDYAEACTGFEFGKQRAVPVITGVVVAKENEKMVRSAWRVEQEEIKRKEDTKRTATALHCWRKMVMGLRIVERMRAEYSHANAAEDEINPFLNRAKLAGRKEADVKEDDGGGGGGFLADQHDDVQETQALDEDADLGGGFLVDENITAAHDTGGGGFLVEGDTDDEKGSSRVVVGEPQTGPVSLASMASNRKDHDIEIEGHGDLGFDTSLSSGEESDHGADETLSAVKKISTPRGGRVTNGSSSAAKTKSRSKQPTSKAVPNKKSKKRTQATPSSSSRKKQTPTKSKYFEDITDQSIDDDGEDEVMKDIGDTDDDDGDGASEVEVVTPRRTTARTRSRR